jgi:large subunit ribosomal protein L9
MWGDAEVAQAILLKDVEGLGEHGTAVEVSDGYLRNYLEPRGLAQPATPGALEAAIRLKEEAERREEQARERADEVASLLSKTVLTIQHRAGEDGKLYGSVTTKEIAEAIREARGIKVDRRKIRLDAPIHEVGTYMIELEVPGGTTAAIKTIVAEEK